MNVYAERTTCRLCGSKHLQSVARLPDSPPGDDFVSAEHLDKPQPVCPVELMVCKCGQVQLRHVFNPDLIYREYTYQTKNSPGLVEHFQEYAEQLVQRGYLNRHDGGLAVEIGSNAGDLLRVLKKNDFEVLGIDPAKEISAQATKNGIPTICDYFTFKLAQEIRDGYGPAALIIANNVLANIDDVADVAEGVRHLLADGGIFVFETSYLKDVVERGLIDTIFHEHLSYFSVVPLVYFFREHGMELFDVEPVDTKGGSIRCFVKPKRGKEPINQRVLDYLRAEDFGKAQLRRWYDFNAGLVNSGNALRQMLAELGDVKIAAYGASDGCTQMIYTYEIARYLSAILDDNPGKVGKFSPGHHIPVLASDEIDGFSAVVILAWRYTNAIQARHPNYRGKWIQVMPEVRVL